MPTKEWHLLITGPGSTWSKLYDRHFASALTHRREQALYRQLEFDFDPYIHVDEAVYNKIKNDSAFVGTAFGSFKPIIDEMLKEVTHTIHKFALTRRKKHGSDVPKSGESRRAFEARLQAQADEAKAKKLEDLNKELLWVLMQYEGKLETEAKRALDAWNGLPKDVARYDRGQKKSKAKIVVLSGVAVVGASLATASAAVGPNPASIIAAVGAWYGVVRTIAGGVQQWKQLNMSLATLMESMKTDLESFSKQVNHKTRAVAAGVLSGATGMQVMSQVSGFGSKLTQLNGKLPQLKLAESERGKQLNEFLDVSEDLEIFVKPFRADTATTLGSPELAASWKTLEYKIAQTQISIERVLKTSGPGSYELEQWSKAVQEQVNKLRTAQGKSPEVIETTLRTIVSLGLASGLAGGMAGVSGIDFNAALQAARTTAALDTTGLAVGGLADLESAVSNFQELMED